MYDLILAPPCAGKSTLAESDLCYDYDRIISVTCGWPAEDRLPAKLHDGRFWKEARTAPLIHAAHVGVLATWIEGPNRPYSDKAFSAMNYIEERKLPIMGNVNIASLANDPRMSALLMAQKVAVWIPLFDVATRGVGATLELLRERLAKRTKTRTSDVDMADIEHSVMELVNARDKHHIPILTQRDDPTNEIHSADVVPVPEAAGELVKEKPLVGVDQNAAAKPTILAAKESEEKELERAGDENRAQLKAFFGK